MSERSNFVEWLADPVKVLTALNFIIVLGLLVIGWLLSGIGGLAFGFIGTVGMIELRRCE